MAEASEATKKMQRKAGGVVANCINTVAPKTTKMSKKKNQALKKEPDLYILWCFVIAFPGIKVGKQ
ncbi:hypothetical protein FIC_00059 [Flavobacteriaceae bacterium 3519-10]|nr:hypothetical protein FIC_00059 [Flavobacteriaceae bacterium 3519-10]